MSSGYIEYSNATGTALGTAYADATTAYTMFALTTPADAPALVLPNSNCKWSHMEFVLKGADTTLDAASIHITLSWDSLNLYKIAGPQTAPTDLHKVTYDSRQYGTCAQDLDIWPTFPVSNPISSTAPVRGTIYCGILPDAVNPSGGDDNVILIRLHWSELTKG